METNRFPAAETLPTARATRVPPLGRATVVAWLAVLGVLLVASIRLKSSWHPWQFPVRTAIAVLTSLVLGYTYVLAIRRRHGHAFWLVAVACLLAAYMYAGSSWWLGVSQLALILVILLLIGCAAVPAAARGWYLIYSLVICVVLLIKLYANSRYTSLPFEAISIFALTLLSMALAGPCLVLVYFCRRKLWPLEPGESLAVALTLPIMMLCFVYVWYGDFGVLLSASEVKVRVTVMILALPFAATALLSRSHVWWRVFFGTIAVLLLTCFMSHIPNFYGPPVAGVLLVVAIITDVFSKEPRHWLHWTGLGMMSLILLGLNAQLSWVLLNVCFARSFH